jgi:hypothetical protein
MLKKVDFTSVAIARPIMVLPVPGGPNRSTPAGPHAHDRKRPNREPLQDIECSAATRAAGAPTFGHAAEAGEEVRSLQRPDDNLLDQSLGLVKPRNVLPAHTRVLVHNLAAPTPHMAECSTSASSRPAPPRLLAIRNRPPAARMPRCESSPPALRQWSREISHHSSPLPQQQARRRLGHLGQERGGAAAAVLPILRRRPSETGPGSCCLAARAGSNRRMGRQRPPKKNDDQDGGSPPKIG